MNGQNLFNMEKEKQIEEMALDIHEATMRASKILVDETRAFVKANHHYHSKNDFNKAHTKTMSELEAEYFYKQGYRKEIQGEWVSIHTVNGKKVCSNCKYPQPYKKIKAGYHLLDNVKYCPNCGCKIIYKGER